MDVKNISANGKETDLTFTIKTEDLNKTKKIIQANKSINFRKLLFKKGVSKIICVSVNDANVMKAWGDSQNVDNKIFMAADPYCEFTKSIGAEIDRTDKGLGMRSARYSMLIENIVIKSIKVEEDTAACEISAAENFIKEI